MSINATWQDIGAVVFVDHFRINSEARLLGVTTDGQHFKVRYWVCFIPVVAWVSCSDVKRIYAMQPSMLSRLWHAIKGDSAAPRLVEQERAA